ncbi:cell wall-binding repeat-containing protein [Ornithinimicrobium faecis]|uniref:cell wall-binding repeat-containing protein n=1 Tax=Ornithinimicrobium faecis TaxID=2934158 RepID=UPI002118B91E|nr:cell wall-binding repeat-containing protein [Ornithinimicrobium sp. HY1745]
MSRNALSLLSAVALAATVSVAPVVASPSDDSSSTQTAETPSAVTVQRLAGQNRYETATEVSGKWSGTVDRAYVVSGHNFPDALIAASRAGVFDAPVFLTKPDHLPSETVKELQRLSPTRITVIGGELSVSNGVVDQLGNYAGSEGVERIVGANRYETSAKVANRYKPGHERVFLASGETYPDALSAAAVAGTRQNPLLLTRHDALPAAVAEQLQRLSPDEIIIVGGPSAVSDAVAAEAASQANAEFRRVAGPDRYKTSAAVAKEFSPDRTPGYVASGHDYADALVVSALAGRDRVPVVLTPSDRLAEGSIDALSHLAPDSIFVVGGPRAVSNGVIEDLEGAESPNPPPGAALLGGYLGSPNENPDERFHDNFGAWPDIASTYYQADGQGGSTINGPYEQARIDRGTIPVLTVTSANGPYSMKQIGAGQADSWIDYWADELAALDGEVWFTFDHEFEVKLNQSKWSPAPSLEDYVNAYNRFQSRVKAKAPNVQFMYWYGYSDTAKIDAIGSGINRPDIIAMDPYVFSHHDPETTFEQMAEPKLDWLKSRGWYDDQPIIFAEFAKDTVHGDVNVANFLTDLRPRMEELGLHGAIYFSRDKPGDVMADLTKSSWPKAREALEESATSD